MVTRTMDGNAGSKNKASFREFLGSLSPLRGEGAALVLVVAAAMVVLLPSADMEDRAKAKTSFPHGSESRLDVNKATWRELELLPEIGERRAKDIVDYRATHGCFKSLEELTNVKGISEMTLERLRGYLRVSGKAQETR